MTILEGYLAEKETVTGKPLRRQIPRDTMTSFRREVITDSPHPRQATDWLAESDQAKSTQDLDGVGSVFGSTTVSFETQDSQIANSLMKIMNPEFQRKVQVAEELQEKKIL